MTNLDSLLKLQEPHWRHPTSSEVNGNFACNFSGSKQWDSLENKTKKVAISESWNLESNSKGVSTSFSLHVSVQSRIFLLLSFLGECWERERTVSSDTVCPHMWTTKQMSTLLYPELRFCIPAFLSLMYLMYGRRCGCSKPRMVQRSGKTNLWLSKLYVTCIKRVRTKIYRFYTVNVFLRSFSVTWTN